MITNLILIMKLWNNETEIKFFTEALKNFASPEQLFYNLNQGYFAYIPKGVESENQTLQSRNALIGQFTERWSKDILEPIATNLGLFAVNSVVCEQIGLSKRSDADLAFCTTNEIIQRPENIKLIFEVKMSILSNYKFVAPLKLALVGDYTSHKGNPALLRSDSMLKAIGKSINIRVSGIESTKIPIIILGNSPITKSYVAKVDFLKTAGVIQGFWSLNPSPTNSSHIRSTPKFGFQTIETIDNLTEKVITLLRQEIHYFSSMISKTKLGEYIRIANKEISDISKAEKFLQMIRQA